MLTFGTGFLNSVINKLPVELHIPGYQFCGPGTKLKGRIARGDPGINPLDAACKEHDIAYSQSDELEERHRADKILADKAWQRVKKSSSFKEKLAGLTITAAMKAKTKLGMGTKKKTCRGAGIKKKRVRRGKGVSFSEVIRKARTAAHPIKNIQDAIKVAIGAAKGAIKNKNILLPPRIIPVPKSGGFLPLIPLFAGLSALGALAGGTAGVAKAVNDASTAKQQLKEAERHNKTMEAVALRGRGLYLKPYKRGLGLYLKPPKNYRGGR